MRVERLKSLVRWREQFPERIAPVVAMIRGSNAWGPTVPDDGGFLAWRGAGDGIVPALIQWDTPRLPGDTLPATGIALRSLTGFHPQAEALADQLAWLGASHLMRVEATAGAPALVAEFELPDGTIVTLGEVAEFVKSAEATPTASAKWHAKQPADAHVSDPTPELKAKPGPGPEQGDTLR